MYISINIYMNSDRGGGGAAAQSQAMLTIQDCCAMPLGVLTHQGLSSLDLDYWSTLPSPVFS